MAWKLALCMVPVMVAAGVAISRVLDYRHHVTDVVVGGALGIMVTLITYFMFFPGLFHSQPDEPFTTRIDRIKADLLRVHEVEINDSSNSPNSSCPIVPV